MSPATPYLFFDGNCRAALEFYKKVFGGNLEMIPYGQEPSAKITPEKRDWIMHGNLKSGNFVLMASDNGMDKTRVGDNVQMSINCASEEELEKIFGALSEKGQVKLALNDTFWGARFGMLIDQFGFHWMLSFEKAKK